ncbi:craniofacial development protein 1 isoform X2 [Strix aluco]|uniref:craniofacial development protein 1 isoform X2 n=1 Tax=Strix aluco TaxID=111821 RepID=UPI003DA4B7D0
MSGSEEYSSAEDEDYVPSGAEYSEDDVSELVREEVADSPRPPRGRRSPRRPTSRKRKKGGLLLEPDEKEEEKAQQNEEEEEEVDNVEQMERNREEEEKKKEDALWASFLSDVGQKPKAGATTQVTQAKKAEEEKSGKKLQEKPKDSGKVTITKVFDFAGEEVRVTKEVDSNSKEAKSFLKQQEKWQSAAPASLPTVSGLESSRLHCSTRECKRRGNLHLLENTHRKKTNGCSLGTCLFLPCGRVCVCCVSPVYVHC